MMNDEFMRLTYVGVFRRYHGIPNIEIDNGEIHALASRINMRYIPDGSRVQVKGKPVNTHTISVTAIDMGPDFE